MATQQADLSYAVVGGTQTKMKIDPNIAANPAYEAVKCDQEDHTYVSSVRGWLQDREEAIDIYFYEDTLTVLCSHIYVS